MKRLVASSFEEKPQESSILAAMFPHVLKMRCCATECIETALLHTNDLTVQQPAKPVKSMYPA
jgi:hypothetical protein